MKALLAAALLCAAGAAAAPGANRALCRENPRLERTAFIVGVAPEGGKSFERTVEFHHCAVGGREKDRPMEVQRIYKAKDGQGLCLTTQLGSRITSARLCPWSGAGKMDAELGPFFTSDLLSGAVISAGRLGRRGAVTLRAVQPADPAP